MYQAGEITREQASGEEVEVLSYDNFPGRGSWQANSHVNMGQSFDVIQARGYAVHWCSVSPQSVFLNYAYVFNLISHGW